MRPDKHLQLSGGCKEIPDRAMTPAANGAGEIVEVIEVLHAE